jgi:peptidoglycan/xylan/chitin deacetylase (PgdA/CDA1 family)
MKKLLFNIIYHGILSRNIILPLVKKARYIFLFHDVSVGPSIYSHPIYSSDFIVFQRSIKWIQDNFKIVALDKLTDENYRDECSRNLASIVFDDGFNSVLECVFPLFNQKQIPFAVFVNQTAIEENWLWCNNLWMAIKQNDLDYLRKIYDQYVAHNEISFETFIVDPVTCLSDNKLLTDDYSVFFAPKFASQKVYLNAKDIKFLHSKGVLIGNHTKNHKHLSTCSNETIKQEIVENKLYLQGLLDCEINHFAIPFGFHTTYNDYAIKVAKETHKFVYDTEKNRLKTACQRLVPRISLVNEEVSALASYVNYPIIRNITN